MSEDKRHVKLIAVDCMEAALAHERMPEIPPERYEEVLAEVAHAAIDFNAGAIIIALAIRTNEVPPFPLEKVKEYLQHLRADIEKMIEEGVI